MAYGSVAVHLTSAPGNYLGGFLYTIVNGTSVTVRAEVHNPYGSAITMSSLTAPFAFIEYTLAN